MPFADYTNFADCVRQNPQARDPEAYCGSIKARTEDKLAKAVTAASYLHQTVRMALLSVVAKRDPVKEEGDKKLKESDGVAADGAQDDQAFAVAFGPDNYDKLTKRIMAAPYRQAYQAAGAIVKALESKQMNFPGNLEEHLKKAHAAVHGREMWDARYGDVCDLLKRARKLLHDIEKTAEVAEQGEGAPQVMGKADPVDKAGPPGPGYGPPRHLQSGKGMGVSGAGGVAKPGWAKTDQPIPGGGSKKPVTPQVAPGPALGTAPLGVAPKKTPPGERMKALRKDKAEMLPVPRTSVPSIPGKPGTIKPAKRQTPRQAAATKQKFARDQWGGKAIHKVGTGTYGIGRRTGPPERGPRPGQKPETFMGKPVSPATPSSRTGMRPAGWGTPAEQQRGGAQKALRKAVTAAVRQTGR